MASDANPTQETMVDVANRLWSVAQISAEHGNALMDIIGDNAYNTVMKLHTN